MAEEIVVRGARQHNLKDITISLPRNKLTVITGLSGSGKSTLAFDTLYAEGQRRYVESLSAYARQFLGLMQKPDVDAIEGLSPAISIEQKTTSKNPRSTVGTVTEIYDYLRLLYARIGIPHCPKCSTRIKAQTPQAIADVIYTQHQDKKAIILAPIIRDMKGTHEKIIEQLKKDGFTRMRVDGELLSTEDKPKLGRYKKHTIEAVIDRIKINDKQRLTEAVESGIKIGHGIIMVHFPDHNHDEFFSAHSTCLDCNISIDELQPRMFSFNSPFGACKECDGIGYKQEFDEDLVMPDKSLSLADGAMAPFNNRFESWRMRQFAAVARSIGFSVTKPISKIPSTKMDTFLYGSDWGEWEGVLPMLERLYDNTESEGTRERLSQYMRSQPCTTCKGKRLKDESLAVTINDKSIIDVTDMNIRDAERFFSRLTLTEYELTIAKQVLKEINSRLGFLNNVGLEYLTMSRVASTLSGGEAQRIRLATQIGSNLTGVMYVLDEPSIGLHQRDNERLIKTLHKLRDIGNTLIVVEHDEDTILGADHVIDIGPGAGVHGGSVVAQGTPTQVKKNKKSVTGQYLSGKKNIPVPSERKKARNFITLEGASEHNLKDVTVKFPTHTMTVVTGVSGSGKSTLINETFFPALKRKINNSIEVVGKHTGLKFDEPVDKVIVIDQSPIGRTPRSNPATYTKIFDEVRKIFAATKESQVRGYREGRFSFNVKGGRCENCQGDGLIKIEMNFLPDVYVPCEECKAKRYNRETLEVLYKGKSIADVLNMTIEEAYKFFENIPLLERKLRTFIDVGLGYIKLGQSSTTLSGGEAQRVKLTKELSKSSKGHTVYLLDEPTTGLHFEDVKKLLGVLDKLVEKKNTVIIIEHNLDVIKTADYLIDLGPEGGDGGGTIVATGTPEEVAKNKKSHTGRFLKRILSI